jgi:alpha-glucosidase
LTPRPAPPSAPDRWWRRAVVYQVYLRSFADGNGDGVGDLAGLRAHLPYLADLGVDAIWVNPWYPSPMVDGGYDVTDYRAIDPTFGTLAEAEALIREAHRHRLRLLLDIVPNHTSDQHPWFHTALAGRPGSPPRQRYTFRPGRGDDGQLPPNDWCSVFGSPAWTRVAEPDGQPGEWYPTCSAPSNRTSTGTTPRSGQNQGHPAFLIRPRRRRVPHRRRPRAGQGPRAARPGKRRRGHPGPARPGQHPHWDRDGVHDIYRSWRAVADAYLEPRVYVAEAWVKSPQRLARYLRPGELHTAFAFNLLRAPWRAQWLRAAIEQSLAAVAAVGAPATWVLSNHDVVRHISRYARPQPDRPLHSLAEMLTGAPADVDLGQRRARAAALLVLALPGSTYLYQGEELGLWEVEDLPEELLQDPVWERSRHRERGRDGARVPLPWSGDAPPFGFSPDAATAAPWLPQPEAWKRFTTAAQRGDPESMLELYRAALRIRRRHLALGDGTLRWLDAPPDVLVFARDPGFLCLVNLSAQPVPVPAGAQVLVASSPLAAGRALPADAAAWLAWSAKPDEAG